MTCILFLLYSNSMAGIPLFASDSAAVSLPFMLQPKQKPTPNDETIAGGSWYTSCWGISILVTEVKDMKI